MRDQIVSQPGVILKKIPYSESDEIISVLMRDDGLRRFFVAGSRKSRKRYQGIIDLFAHLNFHYRTNSQGLWRLQSADTIQSHTHMMAQDIEAYAFSNFLSELICELAPEEVNDHRFYDVWMQFDDEVRLGVCDHRRVLYYLMHVFLRTGYELTTDQSVLCENDSLPTTVGFDQVRGGVICQNCCGDKDRVFERELFHLNKDAPLNETGFERLLIRKMIGFAQTIIQKPCRSASFYLDLIQS